MLLRLTRPQPETFQMRVRGLDAPVTVRVSPHARRLVLSVNTARRRGVLTVPAHTSLEEASDFLARHYAWLRARLEKLPEPVPFSHGRTVPLRGEAHMIAFVGPGLRKGAAWTEPPEARAETAAAGVEVPTAALPRLCVAGDPGHAPRRLKDWLKREARVDLTARVSWHAANLGLAPKRIVVRDQTTRWGSCSAQGVLSFSWRVILAPPFVLDYLAAHEVAHLKEMNHGPAFWALLRQTMPRMEEGRRWFKQHGSALYRYGAEA